MTSRLLRGAAILIAIAGLIDPAMSMSGAVRPRIAVVMSPASSAGERVRRRLQQDLGDAYDTVPAMTSDAAVAIVVGDRAPDEAVPDALPVATVTLPLETSSAARIVRLEVPSDAPAGTLIRLAADVDGSGLNGRTSDLIARIDGLEVGRASHRWSADRERWRATVDVLPVGEPPWTVRLTASTGAGASSTASVADALIDVRRSPFRVEVYEPRPSWATTFVRRALEEDARFDVASVSHSSRGIATTTRGQVPLGDPRLDAFDLVIVGGLERLPASDVRSLDRYLRARAGVVVLLPDTRPGAGPIADFLRVEMTERLLEQPALLSGSAPAALQASELLLFHSTLPGSEIVASTPGAEKTPVVMTVPHGEGRLLVSGAMDAWRFRANDHDAFDRFWQSAIAGLALAVPAPLSVSVTPSVLAPGQRADVVVRVRARDGAPVSATIGDRPIRLIPSAERGVFHGSFVADRVERARVVASVGGTNPVSASRAIAVEANAIGPPVGAEPALSLLSSSHGGVDVSPDSLPALEAFVRRTATAPTAAVVRHPMRSVWWMLPFAACLSAEWWIRRRGGLR
jgi:hypothetical protein